MNISDIVLAELAKVENIPRRQALRSLMVSPSPRNLEFDYSRTPEFRACWVVGAIGDSLIVYCPAGFDGEGSYQWGVVDSGADSMGRDDGWFTTLDQAFIGSGLWRGPRPRGFKLL
jgi:hypothetical protein